MKLAHRPHRPRLGAGRARQRAERGAVLVEFATVAIFLVTMLAGAFDFGMAWRASLAVTEGARAGARVGSSSGKALQADRELLLSAQAALASSGMLEEVTMVVVFNASSSATMPSGCKTGTGTNLDCNSWTGAQFRQLTASTTYDGTTGCLSVGSRKGYCPNERSNVQLTAHYVGIWIQAQYEYEFGLLGSTKTITRQAIMRIEPP